MSTSPDGKLRVNWVYVATVALIGATTMGFLAWALTSRAYGEWVQGRPISGGWSWPLVIVCDAGFLGVVFALFWKIYCDAHTEMREDELSQPSIFGRRKIRWSEVTRMDKVGFGYHVFSANKKIVLTPHAYSGPESVIALLQTRIHDGKCGRGNSHLV